MHCFWLNYTILITTFRNWYSVSLCSSCGCRWHNRWLETRACFACHAEFRVSRFTHPLWNRGGYEGEKFEQNWPLLGEVSCPWLYWKETLNVVVFMQYRVYRISWYWNWLDWAWQLVMQSFQVTVSLENLSLKIEEVKPHHGLHHVGLSSWS